MCYNSPAGLPRLGLAFGGVIVAVAPATITAASSTSACFSAYIKIIYLCKLDQIILLVPNGKLLKNELLFYDFFSNFGKC